MNFKRIELIFFIAFIALDIFLFTSYTQRDNAVESTANTSSRNTPTSIMKSIRNDQISYGTLSNKRREGFYIASPTKSNLKDRSNQLQGVLWSYNNHKLTVDFGTSIKIRDTANPQKTLDEVVEDSTKVIDGKDYQYDSYLSTKRTVVYTQKASGWPVYTTNGQIRFAIRNGYVTEYTQGHLAKIETLREKKPMISQQRALIWLYQYNKLINNSTVEWVRLGYTQLLTVNDSTVYIPTWVIKVKSDSSGSVQYRRINAFTGAFMEEAN